MSRFEQDQRSYYLNEINRSLPTTGTIDRSTLERALQVNDTMLPASGTRPGEMASLLSTYGANSSALQRDAACRALTSPVGMRTPSDRTGCGWWFVPNPSQSSTGGYGSVEGPMTVNLDATNGSGQWRWDPQEAAQLEGMKQAARVQACPDIAFSKYPNIGWCPGTNMALITDGNGNPAYPQAAGGDCPGGGIVTQAANCPPPPPPPGAPPGSASQPVPGSITGECSTNPLTPGCYQAMLPYTGCSPNGALGLALSTGSYPTQFQPFNDANSAYTRAFTLSTNVISNGQTDVQTAVDQFFRLGQDSAAGNRAAQNLCVDATIDYCPAPSDTQTANAPFSMSCIRKAGMALGYPANSPILADNSASYWAQLEYYSTWQEVLDGLAYWMDDARKQGVDGLYDVFGISVKAPPLPYLAIGTQFALRPSTSVGNHVIFNTNTSGWPMMTDSPDNLWAAISNAQAGNMAAAGRSLYTPNMISISTFVIAAGNNQVQNYVSIQSTQYPGYFLRHSNFQIWMQASQGADEQFNSDSSFQIMPQGGGSIAFQSYNYPDQFIIYGVPGQQMQLGPPTYAGQNVFLVTAPLQ